MIKLDPDNFFIKEGYRNQKSNFTITENRSEVYWLPWRLEMNLYYQYHVYKHAASLLKKQKLRSVVDVGCGPAVKLMKLIYPVCTDVTGIDQQEAVEVCKRMHQSGEFLVDDLENPKLLSKKFDLIISADVIEHLVNPDVLLNYIKSISHPNSWIVISTPERDLHRGVDCMASEKPEHVREWNKREFVTYLENRGFDILEHKIVPFIKFSFKKNVRDNIKAVKKRTGTTKTSQMVVCKLARQ